MASIQGPAPKGITPSSPSSIPIETTLTDLADNLPKKLPPSSFVFSGVVALQSGDGEVKQAAHCPGTQSEFSTDRPFNSLSIGKLFTAVAAMQLIEGNVQVKGKPIDLDTKLNDLLTPEEFNLIFKEPYEGEKPDEKSMAAFHQNTHEITLGHLLSHTAGFHKTPSDENPDPIREDWTKGLIGQYNYSNFGYQLLARIIGKHSNCPGKISDIETRIAINTLLKTNPLTEDDKKDLSKSLTNLDAIHQTNFRNHIEKQVFERATMTGACREIHHPQSTPERLEVLANGVTKKVTEPEPYPHGNGCWHMQAGDLLAFAKALRHDDTLISKSSFQRMLDHDPPLGFMVLRAKTPDAKMESWGHPGGGPGSSSFLHMWCTDPPITAAVLSNTDKAPEIVHPFLDEQFKS